MTITTSTDLEKSLNDGESDDVLSDGAIEIFDRLKKEVDDFHRVLKNIERDRDEYALDRFMEHVTKELKGILSP
jgi:phage tail tape-measure protein